MEPLLWWWHWWSGVDPNRDKVLGEARESIERLQAQAERLSSELQARDTHVTALQKDLDESDGELRRLRQRLTDIEGDDGELSRLRSRITELEQATAETDRLRSRIAELEQATAETNRLRSQVAELEHATAETNRLRSQVEELRAELARGEETRQDDSAAAEREADVSEAAAVLGSRVKLDDFTLIEGIGPKIASTLNDAGITTWKQLSESDPSELRRMLTEAGPRFRRHDPVNWPTQAALLAHGRWQEFKDLTTKLREQRGG
jgi:predicted flap endonuclease-1-like 5' DNA nuclease